MVQGISRYDLMVAIKKYMEEHTRFTCEPEVAEDRGRYVKIRNIRLKQKKPYCGNHPAECVGGLFGAERTHRKGTWLEGLDWVEFNDHLNDLLDSLYVSANIKSSVCILRKGRRRRTHYGMYQQGMFNQWKMDEPDDCYEDFCGQAAPMSEWPWGTPGEYHRGLDEPIKVVG